MIHPLSRLALVCLLLTCGCGEKGTRRYHVAGKVTFEGKPVPAGTMIFSPDLAKGNDGLQGYAEIRDGYFDTRRSGKGGPGGAVVVRIEGFDGKPIEDYPFGKPIFAAFQVEVELPRQDATKDFEVPAAAGAKSRPIKP